jgi:uncharacterized protein (UPF0276 family)
MSIIDNHLPYLGLGAGVWSHQIGDLLADCADTPLIDYVEVYAENLSQLKGLKDHLPENLSVVLHGDSLSPGGADPIPSSLLLQTRELADELNSPWVLEDLGVWRLDECRPIGSPFWPPVFDEALVELVVSRLGYLNECFGRPFLCEVPPLDLVAGPLNLSEFFSKLVSQTGCGIVLDVSHWLRYAQIIDEDPQQLWDEFPFQNVVELHISGGKRRDGTRWYKEEHSSNILSECIELLEAALQRSPFVRAVTVESHGASKEILTSAIQAVAKIPEVATLRTMKSSSLSLPSQKTQMPIIPEKCLLELDKPANLEIQRRQRTIREILEKPHLLFALEEDKFVFSDEDLLIFNSIPFWLWQEASISRLKKLFELPRLANLVLTKLWGDSIEAYKRFLKANKKSAVAELTTLDLLDFLITQCDLPSWAIDILKFEIDVLLLTNQKPPRSPWKQGLIQNSYIVSYPCPIIATVNATMVDDPIPERQITQISMSFVNNCLEVEELVKSTDNEKMLS